MEGIFRSVYQENVKEWNSLTGDVGNWNSILDYDYMWKFSYNGILNGATLISHYIMGYGKREKFLHCVKKYEKCHDLPELLAFMV